MENCEDDYHCKNKYMCWYATPADKGISVKRCIPKFGFADGVFFGWSPSIDTSKSDQEYNGILCESGLATNSATNQAKCVAVSRVEFNGANITSPYPCDPLDTTKQCKFVYGTGATDFYNV